MQSRTLFTCPPGGTGGARAIAEYMDEKARVESEISDKKPCHEEKWIKDGPSDRYDRKTSIEDWIMKRQEWNGCAGLWRKECKWGWGEKKVIRGLASWHDNS